MKDDKKTLVQPATGRDLTEEMASYIEEIVPTLKGLDGYVLRGGSPSCSISRVKYYTGAEKGSPVDSYGAGLFGGAILNTYAGLPIESDGRLRNQKIREVFLTKVFAFAALRELEKSTKMRDLVDYHSRNKYLFMSYNQQKMRALGRIVANPERLPVAEVVARYKTTLMQLFSKGPRSSSVINVLNKVYGYFSKQLAKGEKDHFHGQVEMFRAGKASLTSIREMLWLWGLRFDEEYITSQIFFQPFPEPLNEFCKFETY
jgi:uncharacterized protein YbgA (DUF1722 family)